MNAFAQNDSASSAGVDAQNPWPGLASFTEKLKDFFHGRTREADELLRRVGRKNLTVLFGQSGLGKSSLLQAGLFPRLRDEGYLPILIRLDYAGATPPMSEQVKDAVTRAIQEAGGLAENTVTGDTLWEYFHRLSLFVKKPRGGLARLVLVLDQFEELFAVGQTNEETYARAAHFLTELADLIENRVPKELEDRLEESPELVRQFAMDDPGCRALICLREDYLPHLESLRPSMPSAAENRMRLTRMNGLRALDAVLEPGKELITPEVGRQIVRFVAGGEKRQRPRDCDAAETESADDVLAKMEIDPSLLSLVCRELNNRRLELGLPRITADLLAGNRERILDDFYERCLMDQPAAVRVFIEEELVTPDSGVRDNIPLERAHRTLSRRGAPVTAIEVLEKRRLLHREERLNIPRVELTHDVLTEVVKKSRDQRRQREAMLQAEEKARDERAKAGQQRRRLLWLVAGMTAVLFGVSFFGVKYYRLYRASEDRLREVEEQKREVERQTERAEKFQQLADRSFAENREMVNDFLTDVSHEGLKDVPGIQVLRKQFAQKAAAHYEVWVDRYPDNPSVRDGYARALTALGTITGQIDSVDKAIVALEKSIGIGTDLVTREPDNLEHQFRRAQSRVELGDVYWTIRRKREAQPHLRQAIEELKILSGQQPENIAYRLLLARTYNLLGNAARDSIKNTESRGYYERARMLAQELYNKRPNNPECLRHLLPPLGNLSELADHDRDYAKALVLDEEFLKLTEKSLTRFPRSPQLLAYRGSGYVDMADHLEKLKRPIEATVCIQKALDSYRTVAKDNPLVSRYQWMLAVGLRDLARNLSSRNQFQEAKALYEESCQILDALTQGVDDRPIYGTTLIESWLALAEFHKGGKGGKEDEISRKQGQFYCLQQALEHAGKLSKKFPNDRQLHFQIAMALVQRADYDAVDGRNKEANPFYQQAIDAFHTQVCSGGYKPTEYQIGLFLRWTDLAQGCAEELKRWNDVIRLANVAYKLGKECTSYKEIYSLGSIISRSAKVHKDAGRYKEAVESYSLALHILKPAVAKTPWHWYMRFALSNCYRGLAESYEKLGAAGKEVMAWRDYLKIWSGPMDGMKIDDYLAPNRPSNAEEAFLLRQFIKPTPSMKRFPILVDSNGLKYPFHVYVTNVPWPKDPLEDQARWLEEERGMTIPKETRESFRTLHKLAYTDKASFIDVCAHFMSTNSEADIKKAAFERTKNDILDKIADLTEQLRKAPSNPHTQNQLADEYRRLAETYKNLKRPEEAIRAYDRSRLLLEPATWRPNASVNLHESLGNVYFGLGELYSHPKVKEHDKAYTMYQRHHEVFARLSLGKSAESQWRKQIVKGYTSLGDLCSRAFASIDGVYWYLKAMELDASEASKGLAALYLEHNEVAAVLPEPVRQLLLQEVEKTKRDPRLFPESFAQAMLKYQLSQFQKSAQQFDEIAEVYAAKGRWEDCRQALIKEFDILDRQLAIDFRNRQLRDAQANVAAKIALSYRESKEAQAAVDWHKRAVELGRAESALQLADWYEKGTYIKADPDKARLYRYSGHYARGMRAFKEDRFRDALPDLKQICESTAAVADDYETLGKCYGKLGQWDEAIKAYARSVEPYLNSDKGMDFILYLLADLICAERPEQVIQFIQIIEKKGWQRPKEARDDNTLYYGFCAIALRMSGKDASDAERRMRQFTSKPGFKMTGWNWNKLEKWLKTTKLAADRKAAVAKILAELKGTKSP